MTNICINCIHYHGVMPGAKDHFCAHPNYLSKPDMITGHMSFPLCRDMRQGDCGAEGKFYQQKPAPRHGADLKPISAQQLHKLFSRE